jgi:hypothetical protein
MKPQLEIYDTTLRDGSQQEGISLTVNDKLRVATLLDDLGVGYIEGGWPGALPKDDEFFRRARTELDLKNAALTAFGSTRRPRLSVAEDPQLRALTTTSGRRGQNSKMPSLTLSAGLPSTAHPRGRSSASKTSLATSGCKNVIEWPTPLCSTAGATTTTSPIWRSSRSSAAMPGAKMPSSLVRRMSIVFLKRW